MAAKDELIRWTPASLTRALRHHLSDPKTTITLAPIATHSADSEWFSGHRGMEMRIDLERAGLIRAVIHELLHRVLEKSLHERFVYRLEEPMIEALETIIYENHIAKSPRQLRWWRETITAKLGDQEFPY